MYVETETKIPQLFKFHYIQIAKGTKVQVLYIL